MNTLTILNPKMVYLVGGYKLTRDQVLEWCGRCNIDPPDVGNTTLVVNRWLRTQCIKTRLLACDYDGGPIYLVVTNRKIDRNGTPGEFEAFQESEKASEIKGLLGVGEVEFVTVPNPYGD
jgi:hypothetical protein